jgi:MFS family permease
MANRLTNYITRFGKGLWILSLGWFVSAMGFAVSIPFVSIYFHASLGLSISQIGLFFGLLAVVRSVFQIIGGEASDRVERRFLLIYSQMIRSAAYIFLAFAIYEDWGFVAVSASLLVSSIFGAVFQPVANALVADILPQERRLEGYAITRSAGNLGWAAGPAIGGFLVEYSYGFLFFVSSAITLASGLIFWVFLKVPQKRFLQNRFKLSDLITLKDDPYLMRHSLLIFMLYLVVAQLIAPFSVYAVEMVKISEYQLGLLYTLNGLMVVAFQIPVTKLFSKHKLSVQLASGAFLYAVGYGTLGVWPGFKFFVIAIIIITMGEIFMSPPSLALTSRLAPDGKMGRYMGIFGFSVASGWSFGPLYGGLILDVFKHNFAMAWALIASMAMISGVGYLWLSRKLPDRFDHKK